MNGLLQTVKKNLVVEHNEDDGLLQSFINSAISYAESYQHFADGHYSENDMTPTTEQAVIMLASFFYESRDGGTGGFFANRNTASASASRQSLDTVHTLLRLGREWKV